MIKNKRQDTKLSYMNNYIKLKNSLTNLEKRVLYIYYLAETSLYNETIARILKKDINEINVVIEKLVKMGLIKEKKIKNQLYDNFVWFKKNNFI